jgi:hypothetical protein
LNNEAQAMANWGTPGDWKEYYKQYEEFFIGTITPILEEKGIDLTKNFMDTSPSDGAESLSPYKRRNDNLNSTSLSMGDTHFYYLEKDCEDQDTHPLVRFLSESGF